LFKRENTVDKPELSADSLGVYIYGKESPGYKAEFAMSEGEDDIVSIKAIQVHIFLLYRFVIE
jgi:hypothetical protein